MRRILRTCYDVQILSKDVKDEAAFELAARVFNLACNLSGRTDIAIAGDLGVSRDTIRSWRKGDRPVPFHAILSVCRMGNHWPDELIASVVELDASLVEALPAEVDTRTLGLVVKGLQAIVGSADSEAAPNGTQGPHDVVY